MHTIQPLPDPGTLSAQQTLAPAGETSSAATLSGAAPAQPGAGAAPSQAGHSRILLLVSALLIGDAVLILANVRAAPDWLAFVECLVAAVLGVRVFRQLAEATPDTRSAVPIAAATHVEPAAPDPTARAR